MVARPHIVSRAGWGARAPRSRTTMRLPTGRVFIHHTADDRQGAAAMRAHQNFHMDTRRWADFAYSFAIGNDGTIFEGRGAGIAGAHTAGHNSTSHGIGLLGNFENRHPPAAMVNALVHLLIWGRQAGWWATTRIDGHRAVSATACPGRHVQSALPSIRQRVASGDVGGGVAPEPEPEPEMTDDQLRAFVALCYCAFLRRWPPNNERDWFVGQIKADPNNGLFSFVLGFLNNAGENPWIIAPPQHPWSPMQPGDFSQGLAESVEMSDAPLDEEAKHRDYPSAIPEDATPEDAEA